MEGHMARAPSRKRKPKPPSQGFFHRLRNDFLTGLVVVLPLFLTFYVVSALVNFVDANVVPLVPARYRPPSFENLFGIGLVIFLVFTTIVGALAKGLVGREMIQFGERLVDRMPVVRSIYTGLKQIVETVLSQSNASFKQACLVEYPRKGVWAIAFVATEARGELPAKVGEPDLMSVFLPTTPNPTSGFLLYVSRRELVMLDMTVEEAAKVIISAGLVTPPTRAEIAEGRRIAPVSKQAV
jgi:uncharacterized membrane protein